MEALASGGRSRSSWRARAQTWPSTIGVTIEEVKIGMPVQVVPRIFEEIVDIRVYDPADQPGTSWGKAPRDLHSAGGGSNERVPVR